MDKTFFWQDLVLYPTIKIEGEWRLKEQTNNFKIYIKGDGGMTSLRFNGKFWESYLNGECKNGTHTLTIPNWYNFGSYNMK